MRVINLSGGLSHANSAETTLSFLHLRDLRKINSIASPHVIPTRAAIAFHRLAISTVMTRLAISCSPISIPLVAREVVQGLKSPAAWTFLDSIVRLHGAKIVRG